MNRTLGCSAWLGHRNHTHLWVWSQLQARDEHAHACTCKIRALSDGTWLARLIQSLVDLRQAKWQCSHCAVERQKLCHLNYAQHLFCGLTMSIFEKNIGQTCAHTILYSARMVTRVCSCLHSNNNMYAVQNLMEMRKLTQEGDHSCSITPWQATEHTVYKFPLVRFYSTTLP